MVTFQKPRGPSLVLSAAAGRLLARVGCARAPEVDEHPVDPDWFDFTTGTMLAASRRDSGRAVGSASRRGRPQAPSHEADGRTGPTHDLLTACDVPAARSIDYVCVVSAGALFGMREATRGRRKTVIPRRLAGANQRNRTMRCQSTTRAIVNNPLVSDLTAGLYASASDQLIQCGVPRGSDGGVGELTTIIRTSLGCGIRAPRV
jgi:hypothetical protein